MHTRLYRRKWIDDSDPLGDTSNGVRLPAAARGGRSPTDLRDSSTAPPAQNATARVVVRTTALLGLLS